MSLKANLKNVGLSRNASDAICGAVTKGLSATGNASQANALLVTADVNVVQTATALLNSIRLPGYLSPGETITICNYTTGQTLNIYPPVGGNIRGNGLNTAITLADKSTVTLQCIDNLNFI